MPIRRQLQSFGLHHYIVVADRQPLVVDHLHGVEQGREGLHYSCFQLGPDGNLIIAGARYVMRGDAIPHTRE